MNLWREKRETLLIHFHTDTLEVWSALTCWRKTSKEESTSCIRGILSCDVTKLNWREGGHSGEEKEGKQEETKEDK